MNYNTLHELMELTESEKKEIWQIVMEKEAISQDKEPTVIFEQMRTMYHAMRESMEQYDPNLKSLSKMSGGDGDKMKGYRKQGNPLAGVFLSEVMEKAIMIAESNACMKKIVAAPTAGSCGVIPAVLLTYQKQKNVPEDKIVMGLFVAAGIGEVIAINASISGAVGGCQAEIGSASAMAAGSVAFLEGGDAECILQAATLSLKNMLGLVCDPVAGLVEVPCIKRNAAGAVNAVTSAQMALAGIKSIIPADEVIGAMAEIGRDMPTCLKETGTGGLAVTRAAKKIAETLV